MTYNDGIVVTPTNAYSCTCKKARNCSAKTRNCSKPTDVIFLDLSKAFDCVSHERLLLKLNRHGIDGPLLQWFKHFLTNRMQRVVIRGKCSDWTSAKSGVPQGTILGPILFIMYINDISTYLTSTVKIYADDTRIAQSVHLMLISVLCSVI